MTTTVSAHVLVMAKEPIPGQVKTRLCPPCSPTQAAAIAEAALADTLEAVAACGAERRILALAGRPGPWLPAGFEIVAQVEGSFPDRLAAAWARAGAPGLQIGMDTPQVTAELLDAALARLFEPGVDAALGPATDGGWWAIGFRRPAPGAFVGVPMSTAQTARCQRRRLAELGLATVDLPVRGDLDTMVDARRLAAELPASRTARAVAAATLSASIDPSSRRLTTASANP